MKNKSYLAKKEGEGGKDFCFWYIVSQSTITSCVVRGFPSPLINLSYHMKLFITKLTCEGTSSDRNLKLLNLVTEGPWSFFAYESLL